MSFDFSTLVTDRTQADVNRVKQIAEKIKNGTASESEPAEFNSCAMKGAYNYTDLNRVTAAMEALKTKLEGYGYAVPRYQRIKVPHPSAGGGSRLPEGYTELAWIESTGAQYVDTGFMPNQDTKVIMDVESKSGIDHVLFSARTSASSKVFEMIWSNSGGYYRFYYNNGSVNMTGIPISPDTRKTIIVDKNTATIDGYSVSRTYAAFQTECNMVLLARNTLGTIGAYTTGKLYSCQIYDNGTLIRDYVPCKNASGVVGLYDMVNDVFYQNAGSGVFVAGEKIAPTADVPSEEFDPYLWYEFDWPTPQTMTVYLLNVSAIRAVLAVIKSTPSVPVDMEQLLLQEANDIEQILLDVYRQINIMATTFIPCGEALCGGDNL